MKIFNTLYYISFQQEIHELENGSSPFIDYKSIRGICSKSIFKECGVNTSTKY